MQKARKAKTSKEGGTVPDKKAKAESASERAKPIATRNERPAQPITTRDEHPAQPSDADIRRVIADYLAEKRDEDYQAFQAKLIPAVNPARIVGVRTPDLRKLARKLACRPDCGSFLARLPHSLFEEGQLHAFIIGGLRDYDEQVRELDRFLPYVDNWATCDQLICKTLPARPAETLTRVESWLSSGKTYVARFGVNVLLQFFLDDELFDPEHLHLVTRMPAGDYYIDMARAWYVAEALARQPAAAQRVIEREDLDPWTHNKAIQKARESRRITPEVKEHLSKLRQAKAKPPSVR